MSRAGIVIFLLTVLILSSCADLQRAKTYYSEGKLKSATDELQPLLKRNFPGAYYLMGKIHLDKNSKHKALKSFLAAYKEGFKKAATDIGVVYFNLGNYNKALKWLKIAKNNGNLSAENIYYSIKLKINRVSEKEMKNLQKEAEKNAHIAYILGSFFKIKKNYTDSTKYYYMAYRQGMIKAGIQLARVYIVTEKYSKALHFLKTIYRNTGDPYVAFLIGKIYEKIGESIKYSFCLLSQVSTLEQYFKKRLSLLYRKKTYFKKAMEWFRLGNSPRAQYLIWRMKWRIEDKPCRNFQVIIKFSKMGVKEAVSDLQNLYYSGKCGRYGGKFGSELKNNMTQIKNQAIQNMSKDKELYQKAMLLMNINPKKAIKYLKDSCSFGNILAELQLASILFDKNPKLYGGIIYFYAKVKRMPRAMFLLGKIYLKFKNYDESIAWLKKAVQLNYIPAARELALILIRKNRIKNAIELLKKYAKDKYCFAYIMLGSIYEGREVYNFKNIKKALIYYKKATAENCIESYFRLARLYFINKNYTKAEEYIKPYLLMTKNQVKGYMLASKIYYMLGKIKKSVFYFRKAISQGYIPGITFVKKIFPFVGAKILIKKPMKPIVAFLIASKFPSFINLSEEICLLKYTVENRVKGSSELLLKLAISLNSKKDAEALNNALYGNICRKYIANNCFGSILRKYLLFKYR